MKFVMSVHVAAALGAVTAPKSLDTGRSGSIRDVAATLAYDAMTYYKGNTSTANPVDVGNVPKPYYWWVAGALWGAMLDYYHYTKDASYNDVVIQALLAPANLAPTFDYMPKEHAREEGNDDLFFWGSAAMAAAERNFPQPDDAIPSWLDIAVNVFNSLVSRWNTETCGGGLLWQIYADNPNGLNYKNSISNGGLFQLAARLARATDNGTYVAWAQKVWDWSAGTGLIDAHNFHVYDGVDIRTQCREVNPQSFTYTTGVYMYGAAVLANHTGSGTWARRAAKLLDGASWFFGDDKVMYEAACEEVNKCNSDMSTFKGYLSRFMWQTAVMQPRLARSIAAYLVPSARAAAATCTGGEGGRRCGMKWFVGGFDGKPGLGQQMCALETVHGLLSGGAEPPLRAKDIRRVRDRSWRARVSNKGLDVSASSASASSSSSSSSPSQQPQQPQEPQPQPQEPQPQPPQQKPPQQKPQQKLPQPHQQPPASGASGGGRSGAAQLAGDRAALTLLLVGLATGAAAWGLLA